MKQCSGFILFPVLIILQCLAAVSAQYFINITDEIKTMQHRLQAYQQREQAFSFLNQLEHILIEEKWCLRDKISPLQLKAASLLWWETQGCFQLVNNIPYYYVIEKIAHDTCGLVLYHRKYYTVDYYRLSVLSLDNMNHTQYLIQSTVALPSTEQSTCKNEIHEVALGRQMSRFI